MEFIYDFADGHTAFSYVSKKNEILDTEVWDVISSGAVSKYLLPVFMKKENDGYTFVYDIAGMINMMAWTDGQTKDEQMETDRKIEAAVKEVRRKGIPQEEILTEKQYIYVVVSTGEIKLICIPVKADTEKAFHTNAGKSFGKASESPLPLIPPEPMGDMPGELFIEKPVESKSSWWRRKSTEKNREPENIPAPPIPEELVYDRQEVDQGNAEWQERGISGQIGKDTPEKDLWKEAETQNEFPYRGSWNGEEKQERWDQPETVNSWGDLENQKSLEHSEWSKPWEQKSASQIPDPVQMFAEPVPEQSLSDDDSETVLLRDDGDSETVLLKQPQKILAKLIRMNTREIFSVTTENCKIGKRALMSDICVRNNPTISREHCVIRFRDGEYYIEDMDSSNYTYLNGIRVMPGHPKKLQEEDRIRLSDEEFIFRKGE